MDVSVIIVNYNTGEHLSLCVGSVLEHTRDLDFEIRVIDNASTDDSLERCRLAYPSLHYIRSTVNSGFAAACNTGIRESLGVHLLLLNPDTRLKSNLLKEVHGYMSRHAEAGILGCRVHHPSGAFQETSYREPTLWSETLVFTKALLRDVWDPYTAWRRRGYRPSEPRDVDMVAGCFLWIRREVLAGSGPLDEDFFLYYEDAEFCWRVRKKTTFRVVYYPQGSIVHYKGVSGTARQGNTPEQKNAMYRVCFESALKYFRKTRSRRAAAFFYRLCRFFWHLEVLVLKLIGAHPRVQAKIRLIESLLTVKP